MSKIDPAPPGQPPAPTINNPATPSAFPVYWYPGPQPQTPGPMSQPLVAPGPPVTISTAPTMLFVIRWKKDRTYYIGEKASMPSWGERKHAKQMNSDKAEALIKANKLWAGEVEIESV